MFTDAIAFFLSAEQMPLTFLAIAIERLAVIADPCVFLVRRKEVTAALGAL